MAVAHDASSNAVVGTGNFSWTHTPVGTPKGVIVFVLANGVADQVTTVTYGGVALGEVTGSPLALSDSADYYIHAFFLGSGLPTGAQTIAVTVNGAQNKRPFAFTVTAAADTEIHDTSTLASGSQANPSVVLTITQTSQCYGALYSGQNAVTGIAEGTGVTSYVEADWGTFTSDVAYSTAVRSSDFTFGWTATAEDAVILAAAITEKAAVLPPRPMILPPAAQQRAASW